MLTVEETKAIRVACRPDGCLKASKTCWVRLGIAKSLNSTGVAPRCFTCKGKVKTEKREVALRALTEKREVALRALT